MSENTNNVKLGKNVIIKDNVNLNNVIIGDNVKVGKNTTIFGSEDNPVIIGSNTYIAPNCYMNGYFGLNIGKNVTFGFGVTIFSDSGPNVGKLLEYYPTVSAPIIIGDDCWIGTYAILIPHAKMENISILGSHSMLNKTIGTGEVYGGVPAKLIKKLKLPDV